MTASQTDLEALARRYAPIFYFHPDERHFPSSVEFFFAHCRLDDDKGRVVAEHVRDQAGLLEHDKEWNSGYHLAINRDEDIARAGQYTYAPVYVAVRKVYGEIDGRLQVVAYDIGYWLFYPFNGNIADLPRMRSILAGIIAGGFVLGLFSWILFVGGHITAQVANLALAYLDSVNGILMHEGDWEHITVRVDISGSADRVTGICFSSHGDSTWYEQQIPIDGGLESREGYKLESGPRPVVFVANESHACYAYSGTTERLSGFANDVCATGGPRMDPLDAGSAGLVYLGLTDQPPSEDHLWLDYPGRWGRKGDEPKLPIKLIGEKAEDLVEYTDGPKGLSAGGWWHSGDEGAPKSWKDTPKQVPAKTDRSLLSMCEIRDRVFLTYADDGDLHALLYNGRAWRPYDMAASGRADATVSLATLELAGSLHAFSNLQGNLRWRKLAIEGNGAGHWQQKTAALPHALSALRLAGPVAAVATTERSVTGDERLGIELVVAVPGEHFSTFQRWHYTNEGWTNETRAGLGALHCDAGTPIALAAYNGRLNLAFVWQGRLQMGRFEPDVQGEGSWKKSMYSWSVRGAFEMRTVEGYLYFVYQGPGQILHWTRYTDENGWYTPGPGNQPLTILDRRAQGDIGLAPTREGYLAVAYQSGDGLLYETHLAV